MLAQFCVSVCPFFRPLSRAYKEVVHSVFLSSTSTSPSAGKRRHTAKELQEEINNMYANVRALERGTKHFSGTYYTYNVQMVMEQSRNPNINCVCVCVDDVQLHMVKHILKSVCSDLTNAMINFLSDDHKTTIDNPSSITAEVSNTVSMGTG